MSADNETPPYGEPALPVAVRSNASGTVPELAPITSVAGRPEVESEPEPEPPSEPEPGPDPGPASTSAPESAAESTPESAAAPPAPCAAHAASSAIATNTSKPRFMGASIRSLSLQIAPFPAPNVPARCPQ